MLASKPAEDCRTINASSESTRPSQLPSPRTNDAGGVTASVGVGLRVTVAVGVRVGVRVGVAVAVDVAVDSGPVAGVPVAVLDDAGVMLGVGVTVGVGVPVGVGDSADVLPPVDIAVEVAVAVAVSVTVGVRVGVRVGVGEGVPGVDVGATTSETVNVQVCVWPFAVIDAVYWLPRISGSCGMRMTASRPPRTSLPSAWSVPFGFE